MNISLFSQIERRKIDEMRIPEKVTFTLPLCDASVMRFGMSLTAKFLNESVCGEVLLETEYLKASFSSVSSIVPHKLQFYPRFII